jgi:hypothetical protein
MARKLKIIKEIDLSKPVADWLRKRGFVVYSEVPFLTRCLDMVGIKSDDIIVIELKMSLTEKVIRQALVARIATDKVYVGVPTNPKSTSIDKCRKYHIGILKINQEIEEILRPTQAKCKFKSATEHLIENAKAQEPSDIAGLPTLKGIGPAQAVAAFIKGYVNEHPKAGWKEIYENVPNHYSNHKSMAGAMNNWCGLRLSDLKAE